MSWQKRARLAIAVFVVIFVAVVAVALRHRKNAPVQDATPKRIDDKTVAEVRGSADITRYTKDGKIAFAIKAEQQLLYPDGRTKSRNVTLTLPDRGGRTFTVTGDEAEVLNKPGEEIGKVHIVGHVKLTTSDGATVTAGDATYDESTGMLDVPGPVVFSRGRMTGEGVGATYDKNRDVLWLLDKAHIKVKPDQKGQGALEATAGSAGIARADHYVKLTRNGHVIAEGHTLDADEITARLTEDDERVRTLELRANSRMTGAPGGKGPQSMTARDIDLTYADDGRTLQHALLMENGVVQLQGEGKGPGRRIAGKTIDIGMAPDGTTVTNLTATEAVQVDLPPDGESPAKRIRAATLIAAGAPPNGLQKADFGGNVEYRETRAARGNLAAIDRTARSQTLAVTTKPGLGAIEEADFRGHVHIEDGPQVRADAPRVLYHVERDQMDLSPPGDPGDGPRVSDGRVSVSSRTIEFTLTSRKLTAETSVSSSLLPQTRTATGRSTGAASGSQTKVPSMLKQDQPVNITSNRLEYDGAAGHAKYTGNAKLWQGETNVYADTIVIDDKTGNLEATGNPVRTRTMLDEVDKQKGTRKTVATTGSGETFFYDDDKRLATYTTKAHLVGSEGDVTADKIELYTKAGTNELERLEAYGTKGSVVVKEGARIATGDRLTYTAADDKYVLTGKPVEAIDVAPGDCKKSTGARLTFVRGGMSIGSLEGGADRAKGVSIPCPAGTR